MSYERKFEKFYGGPCHGQVVYALIPETRNYVYRAGYVDKTIYFHRGINFSRYYRFFGIWRWEGLDSFDCLFFEDEKPKGGVLFKVL